MSDFQQKALKHLGLDSTNPNFSIADSDIYDLSNIQAGYDICQKEYEEKLRWIPITEKIPENRERVLIKVLRSDKSTYIVTGSVVLDSKLGIYWQSGHATQLNVTHWLSLSFL